MKPLISQFSSHLKLRVAIAQMNCVVGDFEYNKARIESFLEEAASFGVDLVLFPELALTGYPPEDLLLKNDFIEKNKKRKRQFLVHFVCF